MKKLTVTLLSFLLAFVCLPMFGGAVNAETVEIQNQFDSTVLNEYYSELAEKNELINPASDNIYFSYVYTRAEEKSTWYGFQFNVDGTTVILARFTSRLVMYTKSGTASAKISAPEYFASANNGNSGIKNLLGSDVNSGEFIDVRTEKGAEGEETLSTIIANGGMYDTVVCSEPVTVALRKVTQQDNSVVWKYYEDGAYICTIQFENEVKGFSAWFSNAKDYPYMSDFAVKLNYDYNESDVKTDAVASYEGTVMEPNSSIGFTHRSLDTGNGVSYPGFEFTYGENAVTIRRFSKRVAYVINKNKMADGSSVDIWLRTVTPGTATAYPDGAVVACSTSDQNNASNTHVSTALATPGYNLTYKCVMTSETVEIEGKTYPIYSIYEKENDGEFIQLFDIAFPTDEEVKVAPYMFNMTSTKSKKCDFFYTGYQGEITDADRDTTVDLSDFVASDEISVRYAVGSEGLRFSAEISWDLVDAYDRSYNDVEFGMKLVRNSDGAEAWVQAVNYTEDFDSGIYIFNGVVANLKQENYGVEYSAYIYFRYTAESGETITLLSEEKARTSISVAATEIITQIETQLQTETSEQYPYAITVNGKTGYSNYTQYEVDVISKYLAQIEA